MTDNPKANDHYINGMFEFLKDNYGKSIQLLSRAIEEDSDHKLAYMSRGSAFLRLERLDEAIADFDHAIHLNPDFPRSYHLRGLAIAKPSSWILNTRQPITAAQRCTLKWEMKTWRLMTFRWLSI